MQYELPRFSELRRYANSLDHDVIDLLSGTPDWDPPDSLRDGLVDYAQQPGSAYQYPPSTGLEELQDTIAQKNSVDPGRVMVTNGACEANYLAIAATLANNPGGQVVLSDPFYPYYAVTAELLGADIELVPISENGDLNVPQIKNSITEATALVIINNPNNPTGSVFEQDAIKEILSSVEQHDSYLLCDEVYKDFVYSGGFESAIAMPSDNLITSRAFSKSLAITGLRVGYGVFPVSLAEQVQLRHEIINVGSSTPAQYSVLASLQESTREYTKHFQETLARRRAVFIEALNEIGADYFPPDGTFYIFAKIDGFPGNRRNMKKLMREAGTMGLPGTHLSEEYEDWIRFALLSPRIDEATGQLVDFFTK